jgi:hypothetical protein
MSEKKKHSNKKAYFQSGHRQSNTFGKMDQEVVPEGDGVLKTKSGDSEKGKKEIQKSVNVGEKSIPLNYPVLHNINYDTDCTISICQSTS